MSHFYNRLFFEVFSNIANQYEDNYDEQRFGKRRLSWKLKTKKFIRKKLGMMDYLDYSHHSSFHKLMPYFEGMDQLYDTLADLSSKSLLVQLAAYRILGDRKYKLPLSTPSYWKGIQDIAALKNEADFLKVKFAGQMIPLYKYDLNTIDIPMQMYYTGSGIYNHLSIKQYEYLSDEVRIKPEPGDIVLDCGACWGDTALFFAGEVGESGHVYSFEFIPDNMDVFNTNTALNPSLKSRITLVPYPLDETSGKEVSYTDNGPGSRISQQVDSTTTASTLCLDDFYEQYRPEKIDFIKMDIEGMELPALKGGLSVLKKFRPKLAISIYHSMDDFTGISKYIDSLDLGYKFYLRHGTIHNEETVLLAIASDRYENEK